MKKIVTKILLIILYLSVGYGMCYCYIKMDINNIDEKVEQTKYVYTSYQAISMEFESNIVVTGNIELGERYFEEVILSWKNHSSEIKLAVKIGDIISKGEVIGSNYHNGKWEEIRSTCTAKIDLVEYDVDNKNVIIRILNFDVLNYTSYIPSDYVSKINYNSQVYFKDEKGIKEECNLEYIGNEVLEGNIVEIKVKTNKVRYELPGTSKELYIVLDNKKTNLALPKEAVMFEGDNATVMIKDPDNSEQYTYKNIVIGGEFEVLEEGDRLFFYEIQEGLKEGDIVYTMKSVISNTSGIDKVLKEQ